MTALTILKIVGGIIGAISGAAGGFLAGAKVVPKILKAKDVFVELFNELKEDDEDE